MAVVIVEEDCGNPPRKLFLKDLNMAFTKGSKKFISENVTDHVEWRIVGGRTVSGKEQFLRALKEMNHGKANELVISKIITHGRDASVNGTVTLALGEKYGFCDVYEFQGAQGAVLRSITSYIVHL